MEHIDPSGKQVFADRGRRRRYTTTATRHHVYEKGCRIGKATEKSVGRFADTPSAHGWPAGLRAAVGLPPCYNHGDNAPRLQGQISWWAPAGGRKDPTPWRRCHTPPTRRCVSRCWKRETI